MLTSQIWALALNVWREAIRDKLVQLLTASGCTLMLFTLAIGHMFIGGQERVLLSTGFWIMGIWGLMAVLYLGSGILKNEFRKKTVYLILSRPVSRATFLLGKYAGMLMVLGTIFIILTIFWLILLKARSIPFGAALGFALLFIMGEWILLAALSLFFASFTSPILHNFFLIGISFLGHWSNDLKLFSENAKNLILKSILKLIYIGLPNLEALNFREEAIYNTAVGSGLIWEAVIVLLLWTIAVFAAANLIFLKRKIL